MLPARPLLLRHGLRAISRIHAFQIPKRIGENDVCVLSAGSSGYLDAIKFAVLVCHQLMFFVAGVVTQRCPAFSRKQFVQEFSYICREARAQLKKQGLNFAQAVVTRLGWSRFSLIFTCRLR